MIILNLEHFVSHKNNGETHKNFTILVKITISGMFVPAQQFAIEILKMHKHFHKIQYDGKTSGIQVTLRYQRFIVFFLQRIQSFWERILQNGFRLSPQVTNSILTSFLLCDKSGTDSSDNSHWVKKKHARRSETVDEFQFS